MTRPATHTVRYRAHTAHTAIVDLDVAGLEKRGDVNRFDALLECWLSVVWDCSHRDT
jgi:hypothetical protein